MNGYTRGATQPAPAARELRRVLEQQISRYPWRSLAAAVVTGYIIGKQSDATHLARSSWDQNGGFASERGSMIGRSPQPGDLGVALSQELELLKSAAVLTLRELMRGGLQGYLSSRADQDFSPEQAQSGRTLSTATNTSFDTGSGAEATGFDSPPVTSSYLSDRDLQESQNIEGSYPDYERPAPDEPSRR